VKSRCFSPVFWYWRCAFDRGGAVSAKSRLLVMKPDNIAGLGLVFQIAVEGGHGRTGIGPKERSCILVLVSVLVHLHSIE